MKPSLFILGVLSLFSFDLFARPLDTPVRATDTLTQISPIFMSFTGVVSTAVTGCDSTSGEARIIGDFVHCVSISTATVEAQNALQTLLPQGTKINGVYVIPVLTGRPIPQ